jgi:hypothetical protein
MYHLLSKVSPNDYTCIFEVSFNLISYILTYTLIPKSLLSRKP